VFLPALKVYAEANEKVVVILSHFLEGLKNFSKRLQEIKKKQNIEIYFKSAKRIAQEIKTASGVMIGFYDVCHSHLNAIKSVDQSPYSFSQEIELFTFIGLDKPKESFTITINKIISENTQATRLQHEYPEEFNPINH